MAAGNGSRYGGLKQFDSLGPDGSFLMEYSIYDAIQAGFSQVVIITKKENETTLKEYLSPKLSGKIKLDIVVQELTDLPDGIKAPQERIKPWGTAHAVWAARKVINNPFVIINADDFYGLGAFKKAYKSLKYIEENNLKVSTISYLIENTLSKNGGVSRGVCIKDGNKLLNIEETHELVKIGDGVFGKFNGNKVQHPIGTQVAMNLFGFQKSIFSLLSSEFDTFLEENINDPKKEFLLPEIVGKENVYIDVTDENWFGVTYKEDSNIVKNKIKHLIKNNIYPINLWN